METPNKSYDVVVIGAGFAGCLMAMICRRLGKSVLLVERGVHPRFAIGESTTPLTNLLLEEIGREFSLDFLGDLSSWGKWQDRFPTLTCGLKRGFSFFHHERGQVFQRRSDHQSELLVAASPSDSLGDTHWYRESFDQFLVEKAEAMGVVYVDSTSIVTVHETSKQVMMVLDRSGEKSRVEAGFVIDGSGPRGALFQLLSLGEAKLEGMPSTRAVFGHYRDLPQCADMDEFRIDQVPPYPIDAAAVHHLFDGGWFWTLRFNNGISSVGVVARSDFSGWKGGGNAFDNWRGMVTEFPTIDRMLGSASLVSELRGLAQVSFCSQQLSSSRWALLPSAAASIDPLFSTGFPLTLLGIVRLGQILRDFWGTVGIRDHLEDYSQKTLVEAQRVARLIGLAYQVLGRPRLFRAISSLYFTAVSFEETKRRLGHVAIDGAFLLGDHPSYGLRIDRCLGEIERMLIRKTLDDGIEFKIEKKIAETTLPFNVIGFGGDRRLNWYPVEIGELFASAKKLEGTHQEIRSMLLRAGVDAGSLVGF